MEWSAGVGEGVRRRERMQLAAMVAVLITVSSGPEYLHSPEETQGK